MASNINDAGINKDYPVAGQDNDSQGFRDNFNVIKTNFTNAKSEIETLQSLFKVQAQRLSFTGTYHEEDFSNLPVMHTTWAETVRVKSVWAMYNHSQNVTLTACV